MTHSGRKDKLTNKTVKKMSNLLVLPNQELIQRLDSISTTFLEQRDLTGFNKAYVTAQKINELKAILTPELIQPIMQLQGNRLGFKTDKDKTGGYDVVTVKNCLIEAVLIGVQPFGNQFNIIAGNTYVTKEGFQYLLSTINGLDFDIIHHLPRVSDTSAAIAFNIRYSYKGVEKTHVLDFPIKKDQYTTIDSIIGKGTRKARKWLYEKITSSEIADGDIADNVVIGSKLKETKDSVEFEDLEFLYNLKKDSLSKEDLIAAERIITNKETASYNKLYSKLKSL